MAPKAWLRDDVETAGWSTRKTQFDPVTVGLEGDSCAPCAAAAPSDPVGTLDPVGGGNPMLTVRLRTRTGFDDDGVPEFDWTTLLETEAIVYLERKEFDAEAGFTLVKAKATLLYEGSTEVPETAAVFSDGGTVQWRLTSVNPKPGRLEIEMERIDQ